MDEIKDFVDKSNSVEEAEIDTLTSSHNQNELLFSVAETSEEKVQDHLNAIKSDIQKLMETANCLNRTEIDELETGAISTCSDSGNMQNLGETNNKIEYNTKDDKSGYNEILEETSKTIAESDSHIVTDIQDNLLSDCKQSSRGNEGCEKARALQETNELQQILSDSLESVFSLLIYKEKLLHLKIQNLKNKVVNALGHIQQNVNNVNETMDDFLTDSGLCENPNVQENVDLNKSIDEQISNEESYDLEAIAKETRDEYFEFQGVYKKYKPHLEAFMNDIVKKQIFKNMSKSILKQQSTFSSTSEYISSANSFLGSSIKAFEEFQILIKKLKRLSAQDTENRIELLLAVIDKAQCTCTELRSFTCVLLNEKI